MINTHGGMVALGEAVDRGGALLVSGDDERAGDGQELGRGGLPDDAAKEEGHRRGQKVGPSSPQGRESIRHLPHVCFCCLCVWMSCVMCGFCMLLLGGAVGTGRKKDAYFLVFAHSTNKSKG